MATCKIGAVALPLASLFGPDALAYRLGDSGARAVITTPENLAKVVEATEQLDCHIVLTGRSARSPYYAFDELVSMGDASLDIVDTAADDPAFLICTSGTTGPPKGALHAHRGMIGHLSGFEVLFEFFPNPTTYIGLPPIGHGSVD